MNGTRDRFVLTLMAAAFVVVMAGADCQNEGMNPMDPMNPTDPTDPIASGLTVVKTTIALHVQGRIEAGDGIIAYGTGGFSGVDYIKVGDTVGRGVPNGANFKAKSFAVAGKKIIFDENFQLTVFDTTDQSSSTIALTDIRALDFRSDGNFVGVLTDDNAVTDGRQVKVVDVSGAAPNVVSFSANPATTPEQVAVDASNPHVAVLAGDIFYIYDVNDPTAAPQQWDVSALDGVDSSTQMQFRNGYILYHDNAAVSNARLLKTSDGTVVALTQNPAAETVALGGDKYAYFVNRDINDHTGTVARSGIGTVPNAGATLAGDTQVSAGTANNGFVGWGETAAITPDGLKFFLAGSESIGQQEYLMFSTGGAFSLLPDPDDPTADGVQASDVSASANVIAFKVGNNNDTKVGYISLP